MSKVRHTIYLESDQLKPLSQLARIMHTTVSALIWQAIRRFLAEDFTNEEFKKLIHLSKQSNGKTFKSMDALLVDLQKSPRKRGARISPLPLSK